MSSENRKTLDDDMSASSSSLQEASPLIFQETSGLIAKIVIVNILLGILICAWYFGFENQIVDFDRVYTLEREHGIVEQIMDWVVKFLSSTFYNNRFF